MATQRIVADKELERIVIRTRRGARNLSFRVRTDGVYVTVPPRTTTARVLEVLEELRERLREQFETVRRRPLDLSFRIDAPCFKLHLIASTGSLFTVREDNERFIIACPAGVDFSSDRVQSLIRAAILRALKKRAAIFLPPLLRMWSEQYRLPYRRVRITGAKSRWGSCSSTGTISLSCYLMLLPTHLMDYVLLHELAHTREMNHGPEFWALLDEMTHGMAQSLRNELRGYRTAF